jgi:hypothetical protein
MVYTPRFKIQGEPETTLVKTHEFGNPETTINNVVNNVKAMLTE